MHPFALESPTNKAEVLALLEQANGDTRVLAGGTGLINLMKQRLFAPEQLISLHKVVDLSGITWQDREVRIGALETLLDLERDREIGAKFPVLHKVLKEVASPRIRSMATVGGAIGHADPNQDTPVVLMALDATAITESVRGVVSTQLADFYIDYYETALEPGQLITALTIPFSKANSRFSHHKFTPRSHEDYACVSTCIRLDINEDGICEEARIVMGSVAPTILRATDAEEFLVGKPVTLEAAATCATLAAELADPVDDTRGSATYKRRMAEVWVRRCIARAAGIS